MGPEGAVNIIIRKQIEAAEDPDATRAELIEGIRKTIDPYIAARQRHDRRRDRPARDAHGRDRGARDGRATSGSSGPWKKHGSDARMS